MCRDISSALSFNVSKVWLERIQFKASDDANDSSPIKVHLVLIYKADLLPTILQMDSATYFSKIEQLKTDNPEAFEVLEFDVMKGQNFSANITPQRADSEAAIIFARYNSDGAHRAAVGSEKEIQINFGKSDFKISSIVSKS